MDEQIMHLLGGPKAPKIVNLFFSHPRLLFLLPSLMASRGLPLMEMIQQPGSFTAFPGFSALCLPLPACSCPNNWKHIDPPCPSYWCLPLGFAGVSPPPSGPHGRPSARLCSPAGREGWSPVAELQGRKCPGGKDPIQKGREKSRRRVQGRDGAPQCLASGSSGT